MRMFEMHPDEYGTKMEDIVAFLRQNCQPYLREINYRVDLYPLYRGMKHNSEDFIVKDIRTDDRAPQDMDSNVHDQLNSYFKSKFGKPFRDALFVAGTPHVAESFGRLYTVFPMGEYRYIWTPEVYDLYTEYADMLFDFLEKEKPEEFIELMDSLQYRDTDLPKAIESNKEIMIRGQQYAAVRVFTKEPFETVAKIQVALTQEMRGYKK